MYLEKWFEVPFNVNNMSVKQIRKKISKLYYT